MGPPSLERRLMRNGVARLAAGRWPCRAAEAESGHWWRRPTALTLALRPGVRRQLRRADRKAIKAVAGAANAVPVGHVGAGTERHAASLLGLRPSSSLERGHDPRGDASRP